MLFSAIQLQFQHHQFQLSLDNSKILLQTLVERDTEQLANEIFDNRIKAIGLRLEEMRKVKGVLSISVFSNEGKRLTAVGQTGDQQDIAPDEIETIRNNPQIRQVRWDGHGSLLYFKELSFLGQKLGFIRVHYSLKMIEDHLRNSNLIFAALLITTFAVMLIILNLILSKTILRPILRLKDETEFIVQGNYENRIDQQQKDEVGDLASSFEAMRSAIKEKISDLQNIRESLRHREEKLRMITDNMVDIISQTDPQINLLYVSPSIERAFGYKPSDLLDRPVVELVHPDDVEATLKQAAEARSNRLPSVILRYRFKHAEGKYKWVESAVKLLYDEQGQSNGAIFGTRDIDDQVQIEKERKKLEKQLLQTQKLEAIGHLAGGVAHDLNNLLSPILGYTELLLIDEKMSKAVKEKLEQINKAGLGARDLVRQLLAFGRKQTLEYKPLDINTAVRGFEKLIRRTIPEDIELKIVESSDMRPIMADVGQIEQVIMNLSINAADAMKSGGRLIIETNLVNLDETYASDHSNIKVGPYVMLAFSDTGCGMDEKTQEQIFEPFFTTKGQDGTGLGLATVYGIVKQHDGNIWVYSEPGSGTTIKIYFPVLAGEEALHDAIISEPESYHGAETILLVEDNLHVRNLAQVILEQQGYNIIVANDGVDALKELDSFNDTIHLLLTDVVLPNMNGKEIYEVAVQTHPELKVLYMSGYTNNVIAHRGVLDEGINFIQKPFSVQGLGAKVRQVLDKVVAQK
jgi:PAS domain S-box-containing protein